MKHVLRLCTIVCICVFLCLGPIRALFNWPAIPKFSIARLSYGMMAPYQRYDRTQQRLLIEVQQDGKWHTVPLKTIWPFLYGEQVFRGGLGTFQIENKPNMDAYKEFAKRIFIWQQKQNTNVTSVQLTWVEWPYSFAQRDEFLHKPLRNDVFTITYP